MRIADILTPSTIEIGCPLGSKAEVIEHMTSMIAATGNLLDADKVRQLVLERERLMSTGVGKGFACPHVKSDLVRETTGALITMRAPLEFESLDNQPVTVVFMLLGKHNAVALHLRLLSRISRLMNDEAFRRSLESAASPQLAHKLISQEEQLKLDM